MSESLRFASEKSGLPPSSLVHAHEHQITVVNYNKTAVKKHTIQSIEALSRRGCISISMMCPLLSAHIVNLRGIVSGVGF